MCGLGQADMQEEDGTLSESKAPDRAYQLIRDALTSCKKPASQAAADHCILYHTLESEVLAIISSVVAIRKLRSRILWPLKWYLTKKGLGVRVEQQVFCARSLERSARGAAQT